MNGTSSAIRIKVRAVGRIPSLSAREERALAARGRRHDAAAMARLIQGNLPWVVSLARSHERPGRSLLDLISEGCEGLVEAVAHFDPSRDASFRVFAAPFVQQGVRRAANKRARHGRSRPARPKAA